MVLNRNPVNYFAEVEQLAFDPSNMPPGIEPSPDKMLQVRQQIKEIIKLSIEKYSLLLFPLKLAPCFIYCWDFFFQFICYMC